MTGHSRVDCLPRRGPFYQNKRCERSTTARPDLGGVRDKLGVKRQAELDSNRSTDHRTTTIPNRERLRLGISCMKIADSPLYNVKPAKRSGVMHSNALYS